MQVQVDFSSGCIVIRPFFHQSHRSAVPFVLVSRRFIDHQVNDGFAPSLLRAVYVSCQLNQCLGCCGEYASVAFLKLMEGLRVGQKLHTFEGGLCEDGVRERVHWVGQDTLCAHALGNGR